MLAMRGTDEQQSSRFSTDEERWAAVVRHDEGAVGALYYSVRTTRVYCRPGCAARLARRENVLFHESREAAEQAGYRPCRRCRPDAPALAEQHRAAVTRACRFLEESEETPSLEALAEAVGMSRFYFHRIFKKVVDSIAAGQIPRSLLRYFWRCEASAYSRYPAACRGELHFQGATREVSVEHRRENR